MARKYLNLEDLKLTLENVTGGGPMILKQIDPIHPFRDGKYIREEISGRLVTVILPENGYESISIEVADPTDALTPLLAKATAASPVYVDFENVTVGIGRRKGRSEGQWENFVKITTSGVHLASAPSTDDLIDLD